MERKLEVYFEAESARLRAPAGLWERIEGMLKEHSDLEGKTTAWRRVFSPRRWGLVPAFVTTIVLLLAVSGTWLSTAAPWQNGVDTELLKTELGGWLSPAVPVPPTTPTPSSLTSAVASDPDDLFYTGKRLVETSIAGPKGAPGAPGAGGYVPGALDTAQRQVISQASVSMEVDEVPVAVAQVQTTAESLGGFVGQLSSSGGPERQQSTMTIRVPQAEFFTALEHIKSLGKVRSENVGSEDVTERFIDLEARLRSALREEESLLSCLTRPIR